MKHIIIHALTAATLSCLVLSAAVAASSPPEQIDGSDMPPSEYMEGEHDSGDENEVVDAESASETSTDSPPDEAPSTHEVDPQPAQTQGAVVAPKPESFKNELKRMLIGVFLPAVERRLQKTVDSREERQPLASESEPTPEP